MRRQDLLLAISLSALIAVLLAGCSADCEWSATVRTWIDENENGVWDVDESPLPAVKVLLESSVAAVDEAITNEKGEAHLIGSLSGCPKEPVFFVYVLPPPGYIASIQTLFPAQEPAERVFEFGFVPVNE